MENILASKYKSPQRPYSKAELIEFRKNLLKKFKLSDINILHTKCNHKYLIKLNGKKYLQITENENHSKDNVDVGNCSVCWKIFNTESRYKRIAQDLAMEYKDILESDNPKNHYEIELEKLFYNWLYQRDYS